ncbi:SDCG3 protein, partial [Atractosteus spatula]|nr:SDCG3 protein [Atractosteus spatula]
MSKHTTAAKTLIIEDDEAHGDADELNPFSFKEFIRSKSQSTDSTQDAAGKRSYNPSRKKNVGNSVLVEEDCTSLKSYNFSLDFQEPFFPDPSLISQSLEDDQDDDEDWSGSYQPSIIEEAHEFGLCSTADSTPCAPYTSVSSEHSMGGGTLISWRLDNTYEEEIKQTRKGTGSHHKDQDIPTGDNSYQSPQRSNEKAVSHQKLKEENVQLWKQIKELQKKSKAENERAKQLMDELHKRTVKEEKETQALESMVQSVEQNLQLMTKRAVKAENNVAKLKQEIIQLQSQLEVYRLENERLRAGESAALATMKQNARVASEYLNKAANNAETSIKQLLSGAETLSLVSQLLQSIDKMSEMQSEDW